MVRKTFVLLMASLFFTPVASAHPEGGLFVDRQGDIYFTYVHPMTMPFEGKHNACLWRLDRAGKVHQVFKSDHDSSVFYATVGLDGPTYLGHRNYRGEQNGSDVFESRLLRLEPSGEQTVLIPPIRSIVSRRGVHNPGQDPAEFNFDDFHVARDGSIFFSDANKILKRTSDGRVSVFYSSDQGDASSRIGPIAWGPSDSLYVVEGDAIRTISTDGAVSTFAVGMKEAFQKAPDYPLSDSGYVWDIDVDPDGTVYAAGFGSRRVVKISKSGQADANLEVILTATSPWVPHGVVWHNGSVLVLESTIHPDPVIRPRIRKIDAGGNITVLFEEPMPANRAPR